MPSRHWLYFGGFALTAILTVGAALLGLLDGLSALADGRPRSEELVVVALLAAAAEWVVVTLVLGAVSLLFLVATGVSVLRTASLPRDDRLVTVVEWLERRYPVLAAFDVSETVEPTTEDRRQRLKQQYVEGEIGEAEFERRLSELLDDGTTPSDATTIEIDDRSE